MSTHASSTTHIPHACTCRILITGTCSATPPVSHLHEVGKLQFRFGRGQEAQGDLVPLLVAPFFTR